MKKFFLITILALSTMSNPGVVLKLSNNSLIQLINNLTPSIVEFLNKKIVIADISVSGYAFEEINIGITAFENFRISELVSTSNLIEISLQQLSLSISFKYSSDEQQEAVPVSFSHSFNDVGFVFRFINLANGSFIPSIDFKSIETVINDYIVALLVDQQYVEAVKEQTRVVLTGILKDNILQTCFDTIKNNINNLFALAVQVGNPEKLNIVDNIYISIRFTKAPEFINNSLFLYAEGNIIDENGQPLYNPNHEAIQVDYESDAVFDIYITQNFANSILNTLNDREFKFNNNQSHITISQLDDTERIIFTEQDGVVLNLLAGKALISTNLGIQPTIDFIISGAVEVKVEQDCMWKLVVDVPQFNFIKLQLQDAYVSHLGLVQPLLSKAISTFGHYELPLLNINLPLGLKIGKMNVQIKDSFLKLGVTTPVYNMFVLTVRKRLGLETLLII